MPEGANMGHSFTIVDRAHAEISGVTDVDCFNEQLIVLLTAMGAMTISGSALNIAQLNKEEGRLIVNGEIDAIEYSGKPRGGKGGFLARLLH